VPLLGAFRVSLGDRELGVSDAGMQEGIFRAIIDAEPYEAHVDWHPGCPIMRLAELGAHHALQMFRVRGGYRVSQGGSSVATVVYGPQAAELASLMPRKGLADTSKFLLCPMPGLVVSVNVSEGQDVKLGETLAVIEAMKMENVLTAEREGKIRKISARKGSSLGLDDVILEFA
jgi:propionyl-CoA carboxylase alpha chain